MQILENDIIDFQCKILITKLWVVSGLPGAKVRRDTKHLSAVTDVSYSYNITSIGLPTTIPVHLNR